MNAYKFRVKNFLGKIMVEGFIMAESFEEATEKSSAFRFAPVVKAGDIFAYPSIEIFKKPLPVPWADYIGEFPSLTPK